MNDVEPRDGRLRRWLQAGLGGTLALGAYQVYDAMRPAPAPIVYEAGSVVAAAELDFVFDNPAQGGGASGITAGPLLATSESDKCRHFAQGYLSGTACFEDGQWRLLELRQTLPTPEI
jgi:hypothetical protein